MTTVFVECWKCDECGHRWIKGETWPTHCASSKCRKRSWNKLGAALGSNATARDNGARDRDTTQAGPKSPAAQPIKMNDAMDEFFSQRVTQAETEIDPVLMCGYQEYDQETGETMGCGLPKHVAKQKHGNWKAI